MNKLKVGIIFLLVTCLAEVKAQNFLEILATDTEEDVIRKAASIRPTARQLAWQELEITGFLHFGINTFTGKEWGDGTESVALFNPTDLDTDQWVRVAQEAGIKLLILTAKHHDGFCLWPTHTTDYSIRNSPYKDGKGDILKELSESCKKYGMKLGVYLSPWDRNAASYGTDEYNKMFMNQLQEVLTQYGTIDEVWFDGANGEGPNGKKQEYDWASYYGLIRELQPEAVIAVMGPDVRWVGTETGYGRDTEWSVVPLDNLDQNKITENSQQQMNIKPLGNMQEKDLGSRDKIRHAKGLVWYPAETDVSIRPGWFYHEEENSKVKTPEKLLDIYFNSVGKNGVLLLNIPPTKEGKIHDADHKALKGWKEMRENIFSKNLLTDEGTTLTIDEHKIVQKTEQERTYWTTLSEEGSTMQFEYTLTEPKEFDLMDIREPIAFGQRVENFSIEAYVDGEWKVLGTGTTIGYKRILELPRTHTDRIRITISQARLNPKISYIGIYNRM